MPNFPIIDTHLHVWDQTRLKYSAFEGSALFGHPYHVEDYQRDCGDLDIEAMVFLECYADFWEGGGQYIEEIEFVEDEQKRLKDGIQNLLKEHEGSVDKLVAAKTKEIMEE